MCVLTSVEKELNEILLVQLSNTVVDPKTQMRGKLKKRTVEEGKQRVLDASHQGQWWSMRRIHLWQTRQ